MGLLDSQQEGRATSLMSSLFTAHPLLELTVMAFVTFAF